MHPNQPSNEGRRREEERRRQRSEDAHTALSFQLAQVRTAARLDAVVLATAEGLVVAHAGDDELCHELAAVAPIVSTAGVVPDNANLGHGLMHVQMVPWEGSPLYLAGSKAVLSQGAGPDIATWLDHAQAGVARILAA